MAAVRHAPFARSVQGGASIPILFHRSSRKSPCVRHTSWTAKGHERLRACNGIVHCQPDPHLFEAAGLIYVYLLRFSLTSSWAHTDRARLESATQLLTSKLHELQSDIRKLATPAVAWTEDDQTWTRGAGMATTESPTSDPDRPSRARRHVVESSKDFLQIPAHRTTADSVLTWPVFEGRFPSMSLVGFFFVSHDSPVHGSRQGAEYFTTEGGLEPVSEEQLPSLVDGFLQNVHTKNPILDVEGIVVQARKVASEGLRWDPWSCLVLVAAALGAIAKPFHAGVIGSPESLAPIRTASEEDLRRGESCFVLACRRLGSLKPSLLGSQCYFFAGGEVRFGNISIHS